MDKLDEIMKEADRLGFGVSYGKYKAAYPDGGRRVSPAPASKKLDYIDDFRTCRLCGKEFTMTQGNRAYCSIECSEEARAKYMRKSELARAEKRRAACGGRCKECGAMITRKSAKSYCSEKCAREGRRKNNEAWYRNKAKGLLPCSVSTKVVCGFCGKEFETFDHKKKYCSPECVSNGKRAKMRKRYEDKKEV